MEPETSFIGSNGRVHFYPEAPVDLHIPFVIDPGNPEDNDPFGLCNPIKDLRMLVPGILLYERDQRFSNFMNCLMKFWFCWIFGLDPGHELFNFWIHIDFL